MSKIGISGNVKNRLRQLRSPLTKRKPKLVKFWHRPNDCCWLETLIKGSFRCFDHANSEWLFATPEKICWEVDRAIRIIERPENRGKIVNNRFNPRI